LLQKLAFLVGLESIEKFYDLKLFCNNAESLFLAVQILAEIFAKSNVFQCEEDNGILACRMTRYGTALMDGHVKVKYNVIYLKAG